MNYDFPSTPAPSDTYAALMAMLSPHRWTVVAEWIGPGNVQYQRGINGDDVILAAAKNDAIVMHRHDGALITIEARIMGPYMRRFVEGK